MKNVLLTFLLGFVSLNISAQQDTLQGCLFLDFESIEDLDLFEGVEMNNQFEASFGLTFSLEGGGFPVLAEVGGAVPAAFGSAWGNDTPNPIDASLIGSFFLTDDGVLAGLDSPPVVLDFATAIDSFAGCILDMDFGEVFKIEAFGEFGDLILEDSIMAGDPNTGDGRATCWGFNLGNCTGMVYQIKFSGYRETAGAFGLGLDNFSFCYAGVNAAVDYSICEGDSITVNGETFTEEGVYEQLLFTDAGCDSLVYVNLAVFPNYEEDESYSICSGEEIEINGIIYDSGGEYIQELETDFGCDSILNLTINQIAVITQVQMFDLCIGDSIEVNGEVYSQTGQFQQFFTSAAGCDSILQVNLNVFPEFETVQDYAICAGEVLEVNGETYDQTGVYEQMFLSENGCDSILNINLEVLPSYVMFEFYELCEGDELELNGIVYDTSGFYVQNLLTDLACDSIINVSVEVFPNYIQEENIAICDNESIEINGIEYSSAGTFETNYLSVDGCDSTIVINLEVFPTFEIFESYEIFEGESITVNGQEYFATGDYVQLSQTINGCDSTVNINVLVLPPPNPETVVYYDLDACQGGSAYDEFTATYPEPLDCVDISASILSRENGYAHSCTPGVDGSEALCISSMMGCDYMPLSDFKIAFELSITPQNGEAFVLSELSFFEQAPEMFNWTSGVSGPNNYPTLFGIRILRDGVMIFNEFDLSTSSDWNQRFFEFFGNTDFRFEEEGTLQIELLPYCVIGNFSTVTAWDLDELEIRGYCSLVNSKIFGKIKSSDLSEALVGVEINVNSDTFEDNVVSDENGLYAFDNLPDNFDLAIRANDNRDVRNGVSTLDLLLIQKHLLGINTFDSKAHFIAADINRSNSVSAIDLIELRKLILGIYEDFPNNQSWRFFDENDNSDSPWEWSESIQSNAQNFANLDFQGVKIGDINNSASNYSAYANERTNDKIEFLYAIRESNERNEIIIKSKNEFKLSGLQVALDLEGVEIINLSSELLELKNSDYVVNENQAKISWIDRDVQLDKNAEILRISYQGNLEDLKLNEDFLNEIYSASDLKEVGISLKRERNFEANYEEELNVKISPNPFKDFTTFSFQLENTRILELAIYNQLGNLIYTKEIFGKIGENSVGLNAEQLNLTQGIYIIRLSDGFLTNTKCIFLNH